MIFGRNTQSGTFSKVSQRMKISCLGGASGSRVNLTAAAVSEVSSYSKNFYPQLSLTVGAPSRARCKPRGMKGNSI